MKKHRRICEFNVTAGKMAGFYCLYGLHCATDCCALPGEDDRQ